MCWSGSRATRLRTYDAKSDPTRSWRQRSRRSTPSEWAASSSASWNGEGTPASARTCAAARTSARSSAGTGGELCLGVGVDQGLDHRVQVAVEHLVQVVRLEVDPVVGDP